MMAPSSLDVFRKMDEILENEEKWTRGACARNEDGVEVKDTSTSARCFCLMGALHRAYFALSPTVRNPRGFREELNLLTQVLPEKYRQIAGFVAVPSFNDDPSTSFDDVKKLLREVISLEETLLRPRG